MDLSSIIVCIFLSLVILSPIIAYFFEKRGIKKKLERGWKISNFWVLSGSVYNNVSVLDDHSDLVFVL